MPHMARAAGEPAVDEGPIEAGEPSSVRYLVTVNRLLFFRFRASTFPEELEAAEPR